MNGCLEKAAGSSLTLDPAVEKAETETEGNRPQSSLPRRRRRGGHRLSPEQSRRAAEHWGTALELASYFERRYPGHRLDWQGAAALGVCQAVATYRDGEGASLKTHIQRRVAGACLDLMREQRVNGYGRAVRYQGAPRIRSLDARIRDAANVTDDYRVVHHRDLIASEELPVGWELESADEVKALTRLLPGKPAVVMRLVYLHAATRRLRDAAEAMDLSESRVAQIRADSLELLRELA